MSSRYFDSWIPCAMHLGRRLPNVLRLTLWFFGMAAGGIGSVPGQNFQAVYAFGSDMTSTRGGPFAQGRWCNGPIWVEYLSARLGLPYEANKNRAEGVSSSARILNQVTGLPAPEDAGQALFVIMPGILDVGSNADRASSDFFWRSLIDQLMQNTATAVERLYLKGARFVVLMNMPDLAKFPQLADLDSVTRQQLRHRIEDHNFALQLQAQDSQAEHSGLELIVADFLAAFDVIYPAAGRFGFTVTDIAAWHDDNLPDKSFDGPGRRYLFWDNVHPSSAFHSLLAEAIASALTLPKLHITHDGDGPIISIENLSLGRNYLIQRSGEFQEWTDLEFFQATDFTRVDRWPPCSESSPCFFRLRIYP